MKLLTMICLVPCVICASLSGYLCYLGRDGWGWFLFVAFLLYCVPLAHSNSEEGDEENKEEEKK